MKIFEYSFEGDMGSAYCIRCDKYYESEMFINFIVDGDAVFSIRKESIQYVRESKIKVEIVST